MSEHDCLDYLVAPCRADAATMQVTDVGDIQEYLPELTATLTAVAMVRWLKHRITPCLSRC